ncbi:TIGR03943 family putative permease subunit [Peribacillus huizhouensis]|uniref:TIGR03943 family putative permease subunit n=1 Tax=Peribacillus huizhouensis TaxID=1501239 RepID=UPI0035E45F02
MQKKLLHDQIIVARFGVTCWVAAATVYGFMARGDVAHLPLDEWLQLTGTIEQTNYDGSTISIIKIHP